MLRKYKITYVGALSLRTVKIEATSKYDAKQKFYRQHPYAEIVKVEVVEQSETARGCKKTTECCFSPSVTDPKGDVE